VNNGLLRYAASALPKFGAELVIPSVDLPLFNTDLAPTPAIIDFRAKVKAADAVLVRSSFSFLLVAHPINSALVAVATAAATTTIITFYCTFHTHLSLSCVLALWGAGCASTVRVYGASVLTLMMVATSRSSFPPPTRAPPACP
jgi:hypothetical protein